MNGLFHHLILTFKLNFRSKQALVYGYLVPIFFLIALASVFCNDQQPLIGELGMLLSITVLGGACFGMPTSMVSERERGVWRRYRLLPAATGALVCSVMVARFVIVLTAGAMQIVLARWWYHMPWPQHPAQMLAAFTLVCFAFLGMGLVIAMLAQSVPAVQALGQSIFLPMILIGGVGVPLSVLPGWAQHVASFLPGRYAVEALQVCAADTVRQHGLHDARFSMAALLLIGIAGCVAGGKMFRWDAGQKIARSAGGWIVVALAAWAAVGVAAEYRGRAVVRMPPPPAAGGTASWQAVTDAQIASITYDDLQPDDGTVTPLLASLAGLKPDAANEIDEFKRALAQWPPGRESDLPQRLRNLLSICAVADLVENDLEAAYPRVIFDQLQAEVPKPDLVKALAWIILHPDDGRVMTSASEFGITGQESQRSVRERVTAYAKKLLERLVNPPRAG